MAEFTVFYSWQSDLPRKLSRDVIHRAAFSAVSRMQLDAAIEDSPRLDHDTKEIAGTPDISGTIFQKIDDCAIFIADLTFVGESISQDGGRQPKKFPNPNVLLELGYAAARVGWHRVILIMNTAHGDPSELIFDLRNRRFPLTFTLSDLTRREVSSIEASLSARIEEAIRSTIQAEHSAVKAAISKLDVHALVCIGEQSKHERFSIDLPTTMGQVVGYQRRDDALVRLIELGLIRCEISTQKETHL